MLSDPQKRVVYDQFGEEGLKSQIQQAGGYPTDRYNGYRFEPRSADDIFTEFFGFSSPFDTVRGSRFTSSRNGGSTGPLQKGAAIEKTLLCSLEDLYTGTTKKWRISRDVFDATGYVSLYHYISLYLFVVLLLGCVCLS